MTTSRYLADKSALARMRLPAVEEVLGPLLAQGAVASCAIVDLEVLFSARTFDDYDAIREARSGLTDVPVTPRAMAWALDAQRRLARRGQHRLPIADLLVAGVAAVAHLTVIHYDADFERIASATRLRHEWVVPRGSL